MNRLITLLLCICILTPCAGCSGGNNHAEPADTANTVIDGSGSKLTIPVNKEKITIASVYAVAVPFIVALGLTGQVTAINVKSKFWTDSCEGLAAAGTVGRGTVDLEALAKIAPDVLIHRSNDAATVEAVTGKLGIPVLCITVEDFNDINQTLTMMGKYFGREERAKQVCDWLNGKFKMIDDIVAGIPKDKRVSALMMGGEYGRVAGGDMLQSWMIQKAGGVCVAADVANSRNWADVGVETVFGWNPDYIFCTSSTPLNYTVESMLNDSAWSAVTAVRNNDVYIIPAAIDSWDMPGISCAIGTMYMLYRMYPDYFSSGQMQNEIDDYYTFMFGKSFDSAYLGYDLGNKTVTTNLDKTVQICTEV